MAVQSCTDRDVSMLLRRAGNPRTLAAAPLMEAVCRATGKSDPIAALRHVVGMALSGDDRLTADLRDAIFESDFERAATNAQLARRRGVSRRHFQRWKARAVGTIARYAREMLRPIEADPVPQPFTSKGPARVEHREREWRFALECAAFLRARDAGATLEMRSISTSLLRLAERPETRAIATRWHAHACVHLGNPQAAAAALADLAPGASLHLEAKLALLEGELDAAEAYARQAMPSLDDDERIRCDVLLSEVRLMRSAPWRPSTDPARLPLGSWERAAMEIETARHRARQGAWDAAEQLALAALRNAQRRGLVALAARSAGVLSACSGARGDSAALLRWRALAIERLLKTQDCLLATAIFARAYCGRPLDARLSEVLHSRLCLVVPQTLSDSPSQAAAVRELVAALVDRAICAGRGADLTGAIAAVARCDSAFAHYLDGRIDGVAEMLALAGAALGRLPWKAALRRSRDALATVSREVRPSQRRTIAVFLPQRFVPSQSAVIEHLRVDDRAPAGSSTEDVAYLRVRHVSLRAGTRGAVSWRHGDSAVGSAVAAPAVTDSR